MKLCSCRQCSQLLASFRDALVKRRIDGGHICSKQVHAVNAASRGICNPTIEQCNPGDLGPVSLPSRRHDFDVRIVLDQDLQGTLSSLESLGYRRPATE